MKLYKTKQGIIIEKDNACYLLIEKDWDTFINDDHLFEKIEGLTHILQKTSMVDESEILAPIQNQELWACGVTYLRSKVGRQEESKAAGGADFYAKVYDDKVNIRKDSVWDVPEPELTLVVTSSGKIIGYTIGNDMSSRSIEGENPLYLPQAKTYDACAALGPCVFVTDQSIDLNTKIELEIRRNGELVFEGTVTLQQMKRTPEELVSFVYRECSFPKGCMIMTGTGIVPGSNFTLRSNDEIKISIDQLGTVRTLP